MSLNLDAARATIDRLVPGSEAHRRQQYVSASKAGVLFGCDPFCDVPKLAAIRLGDVEDDAGEAAATGTLLEAVVADWWAAEHGVTVVEPTVTYVCGPLSASPDRLIVGSTDLLEVKCTSKQERPIPPAHWWQAQCQMACTGADRVHFAMFFGGSLTLRDATVLRDDSAIADLIGRAETFLAHLDMGLEPPTPAEVGPTDETVTIDADAAQKLTYLGLLNESRASLEREAKPLRNELAALLGAPALAPGSRRVVVDASGKQIGRLRVQQGREKTVGTGVYGEPFAVIEVGS